ncbi:vacuolar cation/proton exchanger 5-like isoform X3 [Cicer arietinum]|uniref:vacuolar cation/proton exchanger 5-like isoform X3 n=1 Tax=Cicer arietinum TaxID=3827 RepID=UPI003CC5D043
MKRAISVGSLEGRGVIELENASLLSPSFPRKDAPFVKDSPIDHECQNFSQDVIRSKVLSSIKVVVFSTKINLLMPFGPLAILIDKLFHSHGWVFLFSLLGIIPLAERLGYTTEQLAFFTGPAVGGLLYATFGNATELIISIHALKSGLIRLVQQSLLGSILSNLLLVLGCALFAGGLVFHKREQVFNHADAAVDFGLLLMADKSFNEDTSNDAEVPEISMWESMIWISILTGGISILSEYLVSTIEGASKEFQMPVAFLSVILLPLVGNAAEHVGSVMFAVKDKLDISLGVAVGSSIQISMFVIPLCVVVGWMIECPMDLNFQPFETTSLFMSVIIVAFMLHNGTSNYFKGMVLILCYLIVSASFYEHIDPMSIEDNPSIAGP